MESGQGDRKNVSASGQKPSAKFRFTVLTPTHNRAHLLPNVYESLCAQTFRDFEWLIVDDGSTDETRDLILSWKPSFPLRYFWKSNGGMHTALNFGIAVAEGEFVAQLDDDDRCVPHALERFDYEWNQIPDPTRYACLIGLCYEKDGFTILGSKFPANHIDTYSLRDALALIDADRWGIIRTDILRRFRFPEFKNERFLAAGVVYNRILKKYAARWFNRPLKIVGYAPGHMSSHDLRWSNPKGAVLYHAELAMSNVPLGMRLKSALNALRFSAVAVANCIPRRH